MSDFISAVENMLKEISAATLEFEKRCRETGGTYNVFAAAGIGWKEVPMCRVLADLLNPEGIHS